MTSTTLVHTITTLWERWTRPALALTNSNDVQQARLLASILIPLIAGTAAVLTLMTVSNGVAPTLITITALHLVGALGAYWLSRTENYTYGTLLLIATVYMSVLGIVFTERTLVALMLAPNYWLAVVLLASQLLSVRSTVLAIAKVLLGLLILLLAFPDAMRMLLVGPVTLIVSLSALMLVAATLRQRYRLQIEKQSHQLGENEERYRTLLKMSFEALLIHEDGIVVDCNENLEQMFGYTVEEAVGRSILDFTAPESRRDFINRKRYAIHEGNSETLGRRKDGTTFPVEMLERPALYRGRLVQVVVMRDITFRDRMEKQKLELAVERERVSVLQRFISDASHDFRSPLTNIKTSLYLVRNLRNNPEKQLHYIDLMEQHSRRLERLLDDLLMMSRLERAADEFLLDPIDLNGLLYEISAAFQTRMPNRSGGIRLDLFHAAPPVWADKPMLAEAVQRILENALNHTPDDGTITLRTRVQGQCVRLDVEDTGSGIEAEHMPYIFDTFFRADKARGANAGGTGLGLPIARKIIDAHDGSIEVNSVPGSGTTFSILLPYVTAGQPPQSQPVLPVADVRLAL
ncbi:MAG: PAS domain-containing sensor histidine kinase [bacterium]|nr:PAS domain-containing sensor histidine kinase [bacterium]